MRTTQVTEHRGLWNWHDHLLVFGDPQQLKVLLGSLTLQWSQAAAHVGVDALPSSQYVEHARTTEGSKVYILNTLLAPSSDPASSTPGDLALAATHGDADSAELWWQLEKYFLDNSRGVVLSQRGGALRARSAA